jgi:SAM-dependent methyltransferase
MKKTIDFKPNITKSFFLTRSKLYANIKENTKFLHGKMMDIGCGSKPYKELISVNEYIGVDFQGEGHSHENEEIDVFYDGKTIPFENDTFDSVLSSEVFEHVFNLPELLCEINRVMKTDANLVITCPFIIAEHEAPNDFARYTSFGIKHLLNTHGFEIIYYKKIGTSIESIMQVFLSYFDSYVISKLNFFKPLKVLLGPIIIAIINITAIVLNFILPKRQDAFLNHIIVCKKKKKPAKQSF